MSIGSDGSIVIKVDLNDKEYQSKLSEMESKTKSFGSQVKNLLSAVGITKVVSAGFSMLKDSIGSAMNRIDTMDQFARTMTTMTGSADIANQALGNIKETVTGTAYGLDVAAQSCQKFVTSGMKIGDATGQVKTWADAVAFYGDGTNETFTGVTDAIAKMVAQGKVQGDQLDRLTDAGIPAVQIFADATGRSFSDVRDALSKGEIGTTEFLTTLQDAMKDGTTSFASIDGAAQQAGASWAGTFDNMKAAVTRGMVSIIESIDQALTDNGLPTMKEMIADLGKTAEKVLGWIADHIPDVIDVLKQMVPVIIAVGTAFATWKISQMVGNATQSISTMLSLMNNNSVIDSFLIKLGSGSTFFAKLATSAINAGGGIKGIGSAFMAAAGGPVTLIIAAIAALVAGFLYLWNTSEEFRNFWYGLWDGIKEWCSTTIDGIVEFFTITIPQAWEDFKTSLAELGESIKQLFADAWNGVISFFTETIPAWIQSVIDWFNQLPYNIGVMVGKIAAWFVQWGLNLINFVTVDIPNFFNSIAQWFAKLPETIWTWLCQAWEKLKQWGSDMYYSASEWISKTCNSVVTWFQELPGRIWAWLCQAWENMKQWGSNIYDTANEWITKTCNGVVEWFQELPGKLMEAGKMAVEGFWNGIVNAKDWLLGKIGDFCSGVVDGFLEALGIHSPSRVMRDMVGKYLPPGIAVGFEMSMPKATKDMLDEVDTFSTNLQKKIYTNLPDISVPLETNAKLTQQQSIVNAFPKSLQLERNEVNEFRIVLENEAEVAHWIAPAVAIELAKIR